MVGATRIKVQETVAELEALIQQQSNPNLKERLDALPQFPSIALHEVQVQGMQWPSFGRFNLIIVRCLFP